MTLSKVTVPLRTGLMMAHIRRDGKRRDTAPEAMSQSDAHRSPSLAACTTETNQTRVNESCHLGVIHNYHHFHKRTNRMLGGGGMT